LTLGNNEPFNDTQNEEPSTIIKSIYELYTK